MVDESAVFQRTKLGRDEVKMKLAGLTQSERRVLIMLDGVTPYSVLPHKTAGLSSDRLERALHKLLGLGLAAEILMPVPNQRPESLDAAVLDQFLRPDSMDPITIMNLDPEDQYGSDETRKKIAPHVSRSSTVSLDMNSWALHPVPPSVNIDPSHASTATRKVLSVEQENIAPTVVSISPVGEQASPSTRNPTFSRPQTGLSEYSWQYLIIGLGVALIILSAFLSRHN
ncbi:MAG: hypothetical protein ABI351_13625 [Herbaspirillum sp.]